MRSTPLRSVLQWVEVQRWKRRGRTGALPARAKQELLRDYARTWQLRQLVETGTYRGDTVAALVDSFDRIVTIELDSALYDAARRRFETRSDVEVLHGDSGEVLHGVVDRLDGPALFWLDGHYSAGVTARGVEDTPILRELEAILGRGRRGDVILVDDARCFTGDDGWPSLGEVRGRVRRLEPELEFAVDSDVIRIHAPR